MSTYVVIDPDNREAGNKISVDQLTDEISAAIAIRCFDSLSASPTYTHAGAEIRSKQNGDLDRLNELLLDVMLFDECLGGFK